MNSNPHNPMNSDSVEETLRLIAGLPAPAGLEERVHKALRAAPRNGRVLAWPERFRAGIASGIALESNWMRAAAAAAIVFVVVGGGWGVYSRVQQGQPAKILVMPAPMQGSGGFSGAGAMRTPETLPGPKSREQGSKGAREQGAPPKKNAAAAPKKHSAQPAASEVAPQPPVLQ
ncbi:MAG: hypothetical protein ABSA85_11490 [Terracidiphilus sp.]